MFVHPLYQRILTLCIGTLLFSIVGCSSVNKKTLKTIRDKDLYTELELLEQELAKDPDDKDYLARAETVKTQLVTELRDAAARLKNAGWPDGAGEIYRRAYEIGGNKEDLNLYLKNQDQSTRNRITIARSIEAAELGYSKRAVEKLLEIDDQDLTFPSVKGLREAVQTEARGKAVRELGNFKIDEYSIRYLEFIQGCSRREPENQELKKIARKAQDRIDCEKKLEEAQDLLEKEKYSQALATLRTARQLNAERYGLDDLEQKILENWALSVYNTAVEKERVGTKQSLVQAQELFHQIEEEIYPTYRDSYDRYYDCRETLADLYYHEADMFLRAPRLSKIFLAGTCARKALEWNEEHEGALQLKQKADDLSELIRKVRVRVEVTGNQPFVSSLESQLVNGLNPNRYSWLDILAGTTDGLSHEMQTMASNYGYHPYPDDKNAPWQILQVNLEIHDEKSKREGDENALIASSKAVDPNASATVTNPIQLAGEKVSTYVSRAMGTMSSTERLVVASYNTALQERDDAQSQYNSAYSSWQVADGNLRSARSQLQSAQSELSSARSQLSRASTPRRVQVGTNPNGTPRYENRVDKAAVSRAQSRVNNATYSVQTAEGNVSSAQNKESNARAQRDRKKSILDEKERRFQQAQTVQNAFNRAEREFSGMKGRAQNAQTQPASLSHTMHKAYRPEHGVAANSSRMSVRGYLVQTQGDVLLESIEQDLLVANTSEFHRHVSGMDVLGRTETPDGLQPIDQYHARVQQQLYGLIQSQLSNRLDHYYDRYYDSYEKALSQQRYIDALEYALRFVDYAQVTNDSRLSKVKRYTQNQLMESLY